MFSLSKKRWQWSAMILLAFIWGASFILMKRGLDGFSYVQVAALRIFISFVVLLPFAIRSLKKLTRKNIFVLLACGLLGNFFPAFLFTLSETRISSSLAGILNGLTPFFTLLAGVLVFRNRPSSLQYLGVLVGFIGASILVINGRFSSFGSIDVYAMLIVLATLMYGVNTNLIRFRLGNLNGIEITSLVFFLIGPFSAVILFFTDLNMAYHSGYFWTSFLATFLLAVFGSVLSLFIFNNLIHAAGTIFSSSVTYIIPFFSLVWGLLDGELITNLHLISLCIILIGVYLAGTKHLKTLAVFLSKPRN